MPDEHIQHVVVEYSSEQIPVALKFKKSRYLSISVHPDCSVTASAPVGFGERISEERGFAYGFAAKSNLIKVPDDLCANGIRNFITDVTQCPTRLCLTGA